MLADIEKDTVDFVPNYDENEKEPTVLPARIPNLLVNGSSGIAVGMATNIPPHNLGEVIDGVVCMIENKIEGRETDVEELMQYTKGPISPQAQISWEKRDSCGVPHRTRQDYCALHSGD